MPALRLPRESRPASGSEPLPLFFRTLAIEFQESFEARNPGAFEAFCAGHGVRGGLLRIPYFWHWVEPNPRHENTNARQRRADARSRRILTG